MITECFGAIMPYKDVTLPPTTSEKPLLLEDTKFIIVPIAVIIIIMLLSVLVYLLAKRRRMTQLRRNILKLYEFDSHEQEWEPLSSNEYPCYNNDFVTSSL